ncbi:hypothetical protein [Loigolactobacillus backii]|uniref:Uncharacterized protein n=1 Tax=Loigolactobacillus backii TaxID=375175 RepID=A0A192H2U1_9LACO|nr:hypothetical protein [Loigolactobacillus backii]ANK59728.1 hypothetical protein AYR52_05340 [Loigolactobacillus backii]ANK63129.1 hypothetical protein AYR53_10365 [Loigolactobacillus backii]ANK64723.1 hypothetical protein AYR54_05355 [Loigolactobacillus backii]ANK66828.1 hypothetical protein AYR55_03385 [Loigolactobacillus backii]ANK69863.1 hypothetical protein AYR56_06640 [Loigolactobacillus backii]
MADNKQPQSREAYRRQQTKQDEQPEPSSAPKKSRSKRQPVGDQRVGRLKHRLNWAIIIVLILIILTYLVLFFV